MKLKIQTNTDNRKSNIELFRIVIMVCLIASHYIHNSGILANIYSEPSIAKGVLMSVFGMWGKPVINCFVLITGFYMCEKEINISKYVKMVLQVLFYNVSIYLAFVVTGYTKFSVFSFILNALPVKSIWTDFVSCYLIFYLFIPFINILIHSMNKKQHLSIRICICYPGYNS